MTITIMILTLILLPIFNVLMDWSSESKFKCNYFNKSQGWRRKYKTENIIANNGIIQNDFVPYKTKWYHFGFKPKYEEKFIYSTTIFVFLTDFWHLSQFLFHSTWQLAIALTVSINEQDYWYYKLLAFVVIKTTFSLMFETLYRLKK